MIKVFTALNIWQKGRILVKSIYLLTNSWPKSEQYGLSAQLRKAAISVPSNIAEGCGKGTKKDLNQYLDISVGSLCELETQIYLASDLGFISEAIEKATISEIVLLRKMVISFQKNIKPK